MFSPWSLFARSISGLFCLPSPSASAHLPWRLKPPCSSPSWLFPPRAMAVGGLTPAFRSVLTRSFVLPPYTFMSSHMLARQWCLRNTSRPGQTIQVCNCAGRFSSERNGLAAVAGANANANANASGYQLAFPRWSGRSVQAGGRQAWPAGQVDRFSLGTAVARRGLQMSCFCCQI